MELRHLRYFVAVADSVRTQNAYTYRNHRSAVSFTIWKMNFGRSCRSEQTEAGLDARW
jgi:hypothetical protein